ncbi:MAG TPA: DUF1906 domain-containing protein [Pseudonocardiaceae bacterium]|nr:DUF1906 domain-containing protein [Pseudonocardiaceae bacterium]
MKLGISRVRKYRTALLAAGVATVVLAGAGTAIAVASSTPDVQHVSYLGFNFTVPASWPVVDLTSDPTACVRYDRHAVYLGKPGTNENCPAKLIGRTEAMLVQPATGSGASSTDDTVSNQITVTTPTVSITATYNDDRAAVTDVLASAGLPAPTPQSTATPTIRPHALLAVPTLPVTATDTAGLGFDACVAPDEAAMAANKAGFTNIGIYIGGQDEACDQPNLTAQWTADESAAGWHFTPIWVGPQASFNQITDGQAQGRSDADQAISKAQEVGFGVGSLLYDDMEAYTAAQRGPAMAFEAAWTAELHRRGYHSGIYSSANSGITDLAHNYGGLSTPDVVWIARFNGVASTDEAVLPAGDFAVHQRGHQYGGSSLVFDGKPTSIDQDFMDVAVADTPITTPGSGLVSTAPFRLLDTRSAVGVTTKTPVGSGGRIALQVTGQDSIPSSVTAVVLNVTVTSPTTTSYLSVFPDGDALPTVSNLNYTRGQTIANLVTVPVIDGAVSFYNHVGSTHVIADLFGYYTTSGGQTYHQVTPTRALDTRNGIGALGSNKSMTLTVAGVAGIPANVSAVIMNVTAVSPTADSSYLAVYPSSSTTVPTVSNLNFTKGQTIPNLVTVPVTNGSVKIYNHIGTVQVLADVLGYYTPDLSAQFTPTTPARLLDTRNGTGRAGKVGALGANGTLKLAIAGADGIPSNVTAVVLNVTAISPTSASFLTVYPDGEARPNVSNLNYVKGQTIPNLVVVPVVNGSVDFYNHAGSVGVTADVAGYYSG